MRIAVAFSTAALQASVWAQPSAERLFESLSPSVWFVYGFDAEDRRVSQGSGVVIAPGKVVTNCHVLTKMRQVFIQRDNVIYLSRLEHSDLGRDICQLDVKNLNAPAVNLGTSRDLKVGQKVYALGNPRGLEATFSDGIVSALRGPDGKEALIQTTAPIAPGSSGGGLFDVEGRLVGITTFARGTFGNLNFAVPVEWVRETMERVKAAEERKKQPLAVQQVPGGAAQALASPSLPLPGMRWKYRYTDRAFGVREERLTILVAGVDGWLVNEALSVEGESQAARVQTTIPADEPRFTERAFRNGLTLSEFAPYLLAKEDLERSAWTAVPGVARGARAPWNVSGRALGWEDVTVPAGTFRALKVEIIGRRDADLASNPRSPIHDGKEFRYYAWYAEETRRPVKIQRRMVSDSNLVIANETLELLEYTAK